MQKTLLTVLYFLMAANHTTATGLTNYTAKHRIIVQIDHWNKTRLQNDEMTYVHYRKWLTAAYPYNEGNRNLS